MSRETAALYRLTQWLKTARPFAVALGLRVFEDDNGYTVHLSDRKGFVFVTLERDMPEGYSVSNLFEFPVGEQWNAYDFNVAFAKCAAELLDGKVATA